MARIKDTSVRDASRRPTSSRSSRSALPLRKSGARYTGRCPFHEERTPSFSVNPVDKLYYCFGCGKGGDVISFVRETESLDFVGAIEWLAERFRVPLEYEETSPRPSSATQRRERLYAGLDQTAAFFERHLWDGDAGAPVREYLASRGLGEEIAKEFRLGLSPGRGLAAKARSSAASRSTSCRRPGWPTSAATTTSRPRSMFPLADARGRVIGFQARKLRDDDPLRGKYVNSPEGELFKKSDVLYGLHLARAAIAKQDRAVVVEGNTDVIALRQAGFEPVVASMGTALTERHLRELGRLTKRLFLCFDADAAGQDATLRGMELAVQQGFDVRSSRCRAGRIRRTRPTGSRSGWRAPRATSHYRVRLEIERAPDRQEASSGARDILASTEDSPERAGSAPALAGPARPAAGDARGSRRREGAGSRPPSPGCRGSSTPATGSRRDVLAACLAHPALAP